MVNAELFLNFNTPFFGLGKAVLVNMWGNLRMMFKNGIDAYNKISTWITS